MSEGKDVLFVKVMPGTFAPFSVEEAVERVRQAYSHINLCANKPSGMLGLIHPEASVIRSAILGAADEPEPEPDDGDMEAAEQWWERARAHNTVTFRSDALVESVARAIARARLARKGE